MIDLNKEAVDLLKSYIKFIDINGNEQVSMLPLTITDYAIELATQSKYVQAEKLKAQIEVLKEMYEVIYKKGINVCFKRKNITQNGPCQTISDKIKEIQEQLNILENDNYTTTSS